MRSSFGETRMKNKTCKRRVFFYLNKSNISIFMSGSVDISGHRKSKNSIKEAKSITPPMPCQPPRKGKQNFKQK